MRKWIITLTLVTGVIIMLMAVPATSPAEAVPGAQESHTLGLSHVIVLPTPAPWRFPSGTIIAGTSVNGLTLEEAQQAVESSIKPLFEPIELVAGEHSFVLRPEAVNINVSAANLVWEARDSLLESGNRQLQQGVDVSFERKLLREKISLLAPVISRPATLWLNQENHTFMITPGLLLDIDASIERIAEELVTPASQRRVALVVQEHQQLDPPSQEEILAAVEPAFERLGRIARGYLKPPQNKTLRTVAGIYVTTLEGEELVAYNHHTVFSGASVMKMAMMLQSYISSETFSARQKNWLKKMMAKSDNESANNLLASIGQAETGSFDGLAGVKVMNATLKELGLANSGQSTPYQAANLVIKKGVKLIPQASKGEPPYTEADRFIHATPADMGRLALMIGQCAEGKGLLLELYEQLSQARCQEMVTLMRANEDHDKLAAGLPADLPLAHKSGWISDMRADVGIIGEGEDALVMSIWLWVDGVDDKDYVPNELINPIIADISRTIYSAYHPLSSDASGSGK